MLGVGTEAAALDATRAVTNCRRPKDIRFPRETRIAVCGLCGRFLSRFLSLDTPHLGLVGDTYTVLLSEKDTAGLHCLIDMHVPPGGGPPPHRHDFEETFILLNVNWRPFFEERNA